MLAHTQEHCKREAISTSSFEAVLKHPPHTLIYCALFKMSPLSVLQENQTIRLHLLLFYWGHNMTRSHLQRKICFFWGGGGGGLTVPEGYKSIMAERHSSNQEVGWQKQCSESSHPQWKQEVETKPEMGRDSARSKPASSEVLLPSRLHNFSHWQCHQMGTKCSNMGD